MPKKQKSNEELIPTRGSLLTRLKRWDDQESWREFFDTYWKLIYGVARQAGLTDAEAQDVVQETLVHVAKKMPNFKYDPEVGSFKAWLLNKVRWCSIEILRKRGPFDSEPSASKDTSTKRVDKIPDPASLVPDQVWEAEWEDNLLQAAMSKIKHRANPLHYQIFDLYVIQECPPEKVAEKFGFSVDVVYTIKSRVFKLIKKEVRRLEKEMN